VFLGHSSVLGQCFHKSASVKKGQAGRLDSLLFV